MARVTFIANYELWNSLSRSQYLAEKEKVLNASIAMVNRHSKRPLPELSGHDVFTPKTIERYTWHRQGTVYGSETKLRDGRTSMEGLYICGTDQGFLGIVGACLSGISMANLHGLQGRP
jgi:phytoene dehydrogenase-like protein